MILSVITSNPGKVAEFREELGRLGISMEHVRIDYNEIQADTLIEVVKHGIRELRIRGMDNFIIDDSGLFIDALGGFPGVYSAYALRTIGCNGILQLMDGIKERGAVFRCCIGASVQGEEIIAFGEAPGLISRRRRGSGGFGFDPIFVPAGDDRTFAEIPIEEKNRISHRGRALRAFASELSERMEG